MHFYPIDYAVWISALVLLGLLAVFIVAKKLFTEFPFFTAYVGFHLLDTAVEFWLLTHNQGHMQWELWRVRECTDSVLILSVIWEVFGRVLRPYAGLKSLVIRLYWYGAAVLILLAIWMADTVQAPEIAAFTSSIINFGRSLHFVELSLLLLLFVCCRIFGLTWRHYTFGIALGFGIKSAIQVVASSIRLQRGFAIAKLSSILEGFAFSIALLIWSWYVVRKESVAHIAKVPLPPQLERWNAALEQIEASYD